MAKSIAIRLPFFTSIFLFTVCLFGSANGEERKTYIVYMGALPEGDYSPSSHHLSLLQKVVDVSSPNSLDGLSITSYERSFNGFAAKLTVGEAEKLARMEGVVSVFPGRTYQLHTTRSWDFLGLAENVTENVGEAASDVIIGVIDTGIWPELPSFSDEGFGPPPKKWKGSCAGGTNFTCNNKIIGARFTASFVSARDDVGHGSHTASTAAGNKVKDVSFYGLAKGSARGGVPSARIAVYKVCGQQGCQPAEVLFAFDNAIADGVDILTLSLGPDAASEFFQDEIAIGAFHAMQKGILTFNSAGNSGPKPTTVVSVAPWLVSVAASTIDRRMIDKVVLGNGKTLIGSGVNPFTSNGTKFPLIYGADATTLCSIVGARNCQEDCIDSTLVKGKIVLCDQPGGLGSVQSANATAAILLANTIDNIPSVFSSPASTLSYNDYDSVLSYLSSTKNPTAEILKSEAIKSSTAPEVASFSSRGPNVIEPNIMKPDITAPGVNILAGWVPFTPVLGNRKKLFQFNLLSGTSMSCPHAASVGGYVKSVHPDWIPSAIQSAILTTATPVNSSKHTDAEFAYGSGQINPAQAIAPGLVYEALKSDYINFLCGSGYDQNLVRQVTGDNSSCPSKKVPTENLNYPALTFRPPADTPVKVVFHRTVKNVGSPNSTYKAKVSSNSKLKIKVVPATLSFKSLHEKKSFDVTVEGEALPDKSLLTASLVWSDGIHRVRSPIIVHTF